MKSRKTQLILAVFLGLFLILVPLQVLAQRGGAGGAGFSSVGGGAFSAIANSTIAAVRSFIANFVTILIEIIALVTSFFLDNLASLIRQTNYAPPDEVKKMWGMMRNFVNIFFILILIVMAYGTIFDIQKYKASALLPRFLVAAILINFSFVIGTYIVDIGNGLSKVFLDSTGNILNTFGQGLSANRIATYVETGPSLSSLFIALLFLGMTMFAFAVVTIFVIVRIPFIWFLLIVSPVAWIGSILPNFRAQAWDNWWKQFIGWTFFLPTYLFFLMFASMFVNAQIRIVPAGARNDLGTRLGNTFQALGVNDIFMFVITIIFMVGGLGMAMKASFLLGTQAASIFGKIEGGVGRFTGRVTGYSAAKKGVKQAGERIKEEGLPGGWRRLYGGERAERLKAAGVAGFFGVKGELAKVRMEEANKETARLKQMIQGMSPEQARDFLSRQAKRSGTRGNAATLEYAKQGYSTFADYQAAMGRFGGEHTVFAREYLKNIKEAKFSRLFETSDQELSMAKREARTGGFKELARALAQDLAEKNRITNKGDFAELKKLFELVPKELRSFINAIKPEVVYGTKALRQAALFDPDLDKDLVLKLINFMKEKKEISEHKEDDIVKHKAEEVRNRVMEILGDGVIEVGKETTEGRSVINEIDKFNPVINVRADNPTLSATEIANKIHAELEKKAPEEAAKFAVELFRDSQAREAIKKLVRDDVWDGDFLKEFTNKASGAVKSEIKKIKNELATS